MPLHVSTGKERGVQGAPARLDSGTPRLPSEADVFEVLLELCEFMRWGDVVLRVPGC